MTPPVEPGGKPSNPETDLGRSLFRVDNVDTPRNRIRAVAHTVWLHLHPAKMPRHGVRFRYTWGAGGLSFLLFLVTLVTGVVLMFVYRPTRAHAYLDLKLIDFDVPFGMFNRNLHRWAAHLMVIFVWLHMLRVFLTGSYKAPRQFNWVVGVGLMVLTMLLSFTGYLLPWDQLAIWAITVGSNMARAHPVLGHEGPGAALLTVDGIDMITNASDARFGLLGARFVGEETLNRFYILHCIAIPLAASLLIAIHFWRVRKDGGISGPL